MNSSIRVISRSSQYFIKRLMKLHDLPERMFALGDLELLNSQTTISVVGSRKASDYGRQAVDRLLKGLAGSDVTIISGLALGIDSLAHRAALDYGLSTIAVLPSGLDRIYPASHQPLARNIVQAGGLLVSEYPPGTRAAKYHFLARNRIIAALADAVLVVEAATRSGALTTANQALDMGINVLAVPGSVFSPVSAGTNRLIQVGAGLVTSAEDLRSELGLPAIQTPSPTVSSAEEQSVVDCLKNGPVNLSDIQNQTQISARDLNRLLTNLELTGSVKSHSNNIWSL